MIDKNDEVSDNEIFSAAENIYDGWYAESGRIDWDDFLDRLEQYTGVDLGSDLLSPEIKSIKRHITCYRKIG